MTTKRVRGPQTWFQMRLNKADLATFAELTALYGLDKSALVRYALKEVKNTKPVFTIRPGKHDKT